MADKKIFRQKSLEKLSTPERLDVLLRIVKPSSWILLAIVGGFLGLAVTWGFVGRLPETAQGSALFVYPRQVVSIQSQGSGQLVSFNVRVGDRVEAGDVIAILNLPDVQKSLLQERSKLEAFLARDRTKTELDVEHARQQKEFIAKQIGLLEKRKEVLTAQAEATRKKNEAYNAEQRKNLETTRLLSAELGVALQGRFDTFQTLREEGLSADDAVLNARRSHVENMIRLADLDVRRLEQELQEIRAEESYAKALDQIADLDIRAQELKLQETKLEQSLVESSLQGEAQGDQIRLEIARLEYQLETRGRIVADHTGRVLEISASVGELVRTGSRIGSMEAEDPNSALTVLAYFSISDGKKIKDGLKARISPVTVERERHGSILGVVESVSEYPVTREAVANQIGNNEVAEGLTQNARGIEVRVRLEKADTPSDFRWTSGKGPDVRITAGTTAVARITTKEIPPAQLVIPAIKSWFQVD